MGKLSGEGSFQIILQSDGVEDFSEYWQDQCRNFYYDLFNLLPKGSLKPLTYKGSLEDRTIDITSFSHIIFDEFATKLIASLIVEAIISASKNWYEYRQNANIKLKYPDGSTVKVSNKLLLKLLEYSKENPQLSIFQVLNHFKDFKE